MAYLIFDSKEEAQSRSEQAAQQKNTSFWSTGSGTKYWWGWSEEASEEDPRAFIEIAKNTWTDEETEEEHVSIPDEALLNENDELLDELPEDWVYPPDPMAEAWAENNEWFGKDSAMTYTAFDLHRKLTEEEGIDPRSDEYYTEIDKRIRLEFPHKFDTPKENKVSKPTQTVASATRSPKTNRKQVRLTSSQVAIARKLGVPLEEYAKQLMNTKEV